jgi:predicted lipid-binding transport protein (Tim44 family)
MESNNPSGSMISPFLRNCLIVIVLVAVCAGIYIWTQGSSTPSTPQPPQRASVPTTPRPAATTPAATTAPAAPAATAPAPKTVPSGN